MFKNGILLKNLHAPIISRSSDRIGWSLCVGAGISTPIFPDWYSLAVNLSKKINANQNISSKDIQELEFSPDALIQMIKNATSLSNYDFALEMSQALYENFKSKIDPSDWNDIVAILESTHLSSCSFKKWKTFINYRENVLNGTTAYLIAHSIMKAIDNEIVPNSIISFNAEPILYIILNSLLLDKKVDVQHNQPKEIFCKVTSSLSHQNHKRIPYIFCHGLLPVTDNSKQFTHSIDKLVFLEEEYLQLANNSFSWQATTFLNTCTSQNIIFIGTSLTDPNMRRWLSWAYANRINEMKEHDINVESSTQHYWIKKIPKNRPLMSWIEAAVAHLGVRLIWIDEWSQASIAIEKLLGIHTNSNNRKPSKTTIKRSQKQLRKPSFKSN